MVRTTVPSCSGGTLRGSLVTGAASGQRTPRVQAVAWRLCDGDGDGDGGEGAAAQTHTRVATAVLRVPRVVVIALHNGEAAAEQVQTRTVPR